MAVGYDLWMPEPLSYGLTKKKRKWPTVIPEYNYRAKSDNGMKQMTFCYSLGLCWLCIQG
jgi:hypothetical protein